MYGDIEIYHSNIKTLHFLKLCSISVMYFALQLKKNKLLIASIFIIAAQLNIDIPISGLNYSQNAGCAGFFPQLSSHTPSWNAANCTLICDQPAIN